MELKPALWAVKHQIKNEAGFPIEFKKRKFLIDLYNDLSPKIAILKPPQIGATVMNCLKSFYVAKKLHKDIIYTLPTQSDVIDIVGGSFNRIIAQNPLLQEWCSDHDTVEQKAVGANLIRYRGTFSPKQATMVPSSLNIHDEVDSSDASTLTLYETRLEGQEGEENKWRWYFSHPSLSGHGIDVYWNQSDKKEWFITCKNGHEQYLTWPENVNQEIGEYVCKVCKEVFSDEQRINGKWIATQGEHISNSEKITSNEQELSGSISTRKEFSGYHISQLMLYNKSAKDIIKAYQDPQKDKQYFYNYVLGLPYIGSEDRIEPSAVLRNCVDTVNAQQGITVIGADTGHGIHYVLMNSEGVFFYDHETTITARTDPYDVIRLHLRRFPRSVAVFDQGGDLIGVRKLQAEYPGRVFLCFYRKDRKSLELIRWGKDDEYMKVEVDRNRMITLMVEQLRDVGRIRLNGTKDEWAEFASHFGNMYREKIAAKETPDSDNRTLYGPEYVWKRNGADHYAHALLYAIVGMQKYGSSMAKVVDTPSIMGLTKRAVIVDDGGIRAQEIMLGERVEL